MFYCVGVGVGLDFSFSTGRKVYISTGRNCFLGVGRLMDLELTFNKFDMYDVFLMAGVELDSRTVVKLRKMLREMGMRELNKYFYVDEYEIVKVSLEGTLEVYGEVTVGEVEVVPVRDMRGSSVRLEERYYVDEGFIARIYHTMSSVDARAEDMEKPRKVKVVRKVWIRVNDVNSLPKAIDKAYELLINTGCK